MVQWAFLAGIGTFITAILIASIVLRRAQRAGGTQAAQEQRGEQEPPKPVLTRATVEANIAVDQWEVIESRLGRAILPDDEQSSWGSISPPKKCIGLISLDVDNAYRVNELRAIPLLRAVRDRLVGLGFRISDDRLWATYVEEGAAAAEADDDGEKAVVNAYSSYVNRVKNGGAK
jgi:hypothetical protein